MDNNSDYNDMLKLITIKKQTNKKTKEKNQTASVVFHSQYPPHVFVLPKMTLGRAMLLHYLKRLKMVLFTITFIWAGC